MKLFEFNIIELYLLGCIGLFFLIQITYYLLLYNRKNRNNKQSKIKEQPANYPPLSVVIYAKDEVYNLREFLPLILQQDYPEFQVVVINDNPTDGSDDYLKLLEEKHKNLYHSFTPNSARYISHKKLGLTLGVKASKYDWLVFTDANCKPASPNWLKCMADNFTPETKIVLGGYGYEKGNKWLNKKISFDTLFRNMRVLGMALCGSPFAGFGRNMAYRKELFYSVKGFSRHLNLQRGYDDLFINQVAKKSITKVETRSDAMMWLKPLSYKKPWREDKLNHVITSGFYKGGQKYLLGMETLSRLLFYTSIIGSVVYGIVYMKYILMGAAVLLWVIRYIVQALVINKTAKNLGYKERYYLTLPLFDILQPLQSLRYKILCRIRGKNEFMRR